MINPGRVTFIPKLFSHPFGNEKSITEKRSQAKLFKKTTYISGRVFWVKKTYSIIRKKELLKSSWQLSKFFI